MYFSNYLEHFFDRLVHLFNRLMHYSWVLARQKNSFVYDNFLTGLKSLNLTFVYDNF